MTLDVNTIEFASLSVLIVDDDNFQLQVMQQLLSKIGVGNIRQADGAVAALEIVAELGDGLHVVISDLDMPGVDGMEFLRLLSEGESNVAIIVSSSKHESVLRSVELMAKEYGLGVLGTLAKPATLSALRDKLAAYLQPSRIRKMGEAGAVSKEDLLQGLEFGQIEPFFQPKVELASRRICGAEALARWRHPERGILPPGAFIAVAEQNGLIDRLTWLMLEQTAAQISQWSKAGRDIPVSVNFSHTSLADTKISGRIQEIMSIHGVAPEKLIVEVTETVMMTDIAHCLETLSRLRMMGVGLSIDDFGTGYSSLQQLSRVPYTELKIDQGFVTGAATQAHLRVVIKSSVDIARKLNLKCVAEGIETLEDWNCLKTLGCEIGQGYYIARPMEGSRFLDWVRNWEESPSL